MEDVTIKKKTNGPRNRRAGHGFELIVVKAIQQMFPNVCTSRSSNRMRDAEKVDLCNKDEYQHGRLPYNIQCKNTAGSVSYATLLKQLPTEKGIMNVVFHRMTRKSGDRFMVSGEYAFTRMIDYLKLMKFRAGFELLNKYIDLLPEEIREELQAELELLEI